MVIDSKLKLLPVGPMSRMLHVPMKWLKAEAQAGRLPHIKAGNVFLFNPETVEAVLLERARKINERSL